VTRVPRLLAASLVYTLAAGAAGLTPAQRKLNADSFEYAWKAIRDHMWEPMPAGLDWQKVRAELKPKAEEAPTMDEARAVMRDMIARLKLTHFNLIPADAYEKLGERPKRGSGNSGTPGFDLRVLDDQAVVVSVEPESPAYRAGVRPGWILKRAGGSKVDSLIAELRKSLPDATVKRLQINRAVAALLDGDAGSTVPAEFLNAGGGRVKLDIELTAVRGNPTTLGFMPTQYVWFDARRIGNTGYIRFNLFMDPGRVAPAFADAVQSCMKCAGMIIDLRGNPGGIGGMSMGLAGWFVSKPNVRLGVMKMNGSELKFTIIPRADTFGGPVAILVDEMTASTSEIFAGGMRDIGRARVFGTRTAGAALPSVIERLPNGDGFQYAIANYISEGGKPLEGTGVIPDQEVPLRREALLAGHDPVVDAALEWINKEGKQP
jgi:carboxyl-terminal processing protease